MALKALLLQRLRTLLAMLGVIIVITAVIALLSVGTAASDSVTSKVSSLGARTIEISPFGQSGVTLSESDVGWLLRRVHEFKAAAPVLSGSVTSYQGGKSWSTTLIGTASALLAIEGRSIAIGRGISQSNTAQGSPVAVIGSTTANKLFSGQNPVGQEITLDGMPVTVVGELQTEGSSQGFGQDPDDEIVVPIPLAEDILGTANLSEVVAQ
jgi:putative ABC transport system permease protein